MTLTETLLFYEATRPKQPGDYAGSLTGSDVERLQGMLRDNESS